ncbi:TonB-dependent receptor [Porticoccus sp.]
MRNKKPVTNVVFPSSVYLTATAFYLLVAPSISYGAESSPVVEEIEVVAAAPRQGLSANVDSLPMHVQSLKLELDDVQNTPALGDLLSRRFAGVTMNMAQNNPLQPDLQFRGYTASPLLGLPQGIAIYQNGVRVNAPFGETVNWELLPLEAIDRVDLIAGANPLFGYNSLGGVLNLRMKNGFSFDESWLGASAGEYGRRQNSLEWGGNNGTSGLYVYASGFEEDGWRDNSFSRVNNIYSAYTYRGEQQEVEFSVQLGEGSLRGNGPAPTQLLDAEGDDVVFTHPDITDNRLVQLSLEHRWLLGDDMTLTSGLFARRLETQSFNGDGTEYEECDSGGDEWLVEEFDDVDMDGECNAAIDANIEYVRDQNNQLADGDLNAINNRSHIVQRDWGGDVQLEWQRPLFGIEAHHHIGARLSRAITEFKAQVELAELADDRSTIGRGSFVPDEATDMLSSSTTGGLFSGTQLFLTEKLTATFSGNYLKANVKLSDRSGEQPELEGDHDFQHISLSTGLNYQFTDNLSGYAAYSQSMRLPTAIELACADPEFECSLPNAFLADPPLDKVVVDNWELGMRGKASIWHWQGSLFYSRNRDDIIFQSTGGSIGNRGYFDNIDSTERWGINLSAQAQWNKFSGFLNYSYLKAVYGDDWQVASPNHPDNIDGQLSVEKGDRLPGLPRHSLQAELEYALDSDFRVSLEGQFVSSIHVRGDESNQMREIPSYAVYALSSRYNVNDRLVLTARVDNLFDREYASFGLLGEPDEVLGDEFDDPLFLSRGAPRMASVGLRWKL